MQTKNPITYRTNFDKNGFLKFFLEERQFLIAVLRPKVHLIDYINVHTPYFGSCQSYNSKIGIQSTLLKLHKIWMVNLMSNSITFS